MARIRVIIRKFHTELDNANISWKNCERYCKLNEFCEACDRFEVSFAKLCPGGFKYISDFTILEVRNG